MKTHIVLNLRLVSLRSLASLRHVLGAQLLVLLAMLLFAPTPALSQQLVDNIPASNATPGGAVSVGFTRDAAQGFGTGGHSDGYTVTSVDLVIPVVSGRPTPVYTVGIWSASNGLPNTSLGALTAPNPIVDGVNTFTTSGIDLAANTTYFVVVDVTTSGTEHAWQTTTSLDENRRRAPGWTISDSIHTRRLNSFAQWASTTSPAQMRISGVARNATNIPPVAYNSTRTTTEDTEFTYATRHFRFYDADDGATLVNVRIVTLPASDKGTLTLNGANVSANDSVTRTQIRDGNLKYIPPANAHGSNYASFTFKVSDGTDESATYTVTMSIRPMNDPATGAPTISGTAQAGLMLTASPGTIADVEGLAGVSYGYQWIRVDADGTSNPTDIAGATNSTYTAARDDVGKTLKVRVSFTDDAGFAEQRTSEPTATVVVDPTVGICGRTLQVRDALVALIPGVSNCADVTASHLAAITGTLRLNSVGLTALAAGDFDGLTSVRRLFLADNALATLGEGVFDGLTSLSDLYLQNNQLTTLDDDVFEPLTALRDLHLADNALATLPDGVFDGLTSLSELYLQNNRLTTLPDDVFEPLTALSELHLQNNRLTTLPDDVFEPLTALSELYLQNNRLTTLPDDVFEPLTALSELYLQNNALATLPDGVFDGLTALTELYLQDNQLTTLPDDVFEPLTALTTLYLRGNPGASFAPEAVALPDDGTVSNGGGTVTLDGSGSGGPWGTNVTYGWALTDPTSGVTVTFDDAASATPVVTIPALATDPELTFTLTVTGRGGTDGIAPATDTATVTAILDPTLGICGRTEQVRDALVALIPGVSHCADVTAPHLAAITGALRLNSVGLTALAAGDFDGLTSLSELHLPNNPLTTLPDDVFEPLTALSALYLDANALTTLDDDVFDGLTSLRDLALGSNDLTTLPDDVFDGLTSLRDLALGYNDLTTLPDDVFDGLTSLTDLSLSGNDLTTLPDDVFDGLTALTNLALRDNPGAPFAPEAVALPDDGTVSNGGGTVTLDGSGSGGPWGTNVTYGWALTDPVSGVTVTFDDAASATPVVTIPALATDPELTFTLTVTGRGGTDGIAPATDTATVTAILDPTLGICGRTEQVRDALVALIPGVSHCADVTAPHLAAITGTLLLSGENITALAAGDFEGLTALTSLDLSRNQLTALPDDVFDGLTSLTSLVLSYNDLATLPDDVFDGLTSLEQLYLDENDLATLPADVFDGLTSLEELHLNDNDLATLLADVFDGLTSLEELHLNDNDLATLLADVFDGLTTLRDLALGYNDLTTLPDDVFDGLTSLSDLYLQNNQLTTLPDDVFEPLTSLRRLFLADNALATLGEGVFDGLTSLERLHLNNNELTTLDDDVFEPLTALTDLALRGNPGALFAPEAVALPDDGTVSNGGGTVTLDGSGSGGPWGTNVTYGWALTDPVSGVTVTFDDAASATPVVTIPALATGTGLTFTLTVTGRGGTDGIAPATDTATVTAIFDPTLGICGRTEQVRDALVALIPGVSNCADVTAPHLAAITRPLLLSGENITALAAGDFDGLTSVRRLFLADNALATLGEGVFDGLTSLSDLYLQNNQLTTLDDDVFEPLTSLRRLYLGENDLATLPADVFDGLTALSELYLQNNQLTTLPGDVFDGLTSLTDLDLGFNDLYLTTLTDDVFQPLTALTTLALRGNPGAPFAPEAVALPDDGTVSNGGGTVTLDGSGSDGGPWGTNVTYGWALTDPTSGVTVTFDDAASAMPVVTIPALATDPELTFTLTVTGRGGTDGIAPATDTATVTAILDPTLGICGRTEQVRDALVALIPRVSHCADVTAPHLAAITGTLLLSGENITALAAGDFEGLTSLTSLDLSRNGLTALPDDVFDGLTSLPSLDLSYNDLATLTSLVLSYNELTTLPDDVFDGLTSLEQLYLDENDLATLPADVFDGLTSLEELHLNDNDLATLLADVFEPLTALTNLALRDNPGAPFAPEAVALPDDGTVSNGGGTVTLDGSGSDGGPWGTNVTYGWALTDPVSGVTVTFDDAASATPVVTIPALATDPELTFTLTVTGRGGTDGIAPATDTATVTAILDPTLGICGRTEQVRDALVALIPGVSHCADVTAPHLAAITRTLLLSGENITALAAGDFEGLTSLTSLDLSRNGLTAMPDDVFNGLTSLTSLVLSYNDLATLPDDVFNGLTSLEQLYLDENDLATLPDDVFEPLTALIALALRDNPGAPFAPEAVALPDDGTVSNGGGTVTLDGSGSGGPWGTNVTYGWALTDPVSGVTVTFDDAASATPVVTIPALATGTGLTFTLTVTGRGGTDGIASATDTATVTAILDPTLGICGRTEQVRDALVALIPGVSHCADVTAPHLAAITGTLLLSGENITALAAGDFDGLTALTVLTWPDNDLTALPDDVFDGLTSLTSLDLSYNDLATLPDDVFDGLTSLTPVPERQRSGHAAR